MFFAQFIFLWHGECLVIFLDAEIHTSYRKWRHIKIDERMETATNQLLLSRVIMPHLSLQFVCQKWWCQRGLLFNWLQYHVLMKNISFQAFRKGLNTYLNKFKYSNTVTGMLTYSLSCNYNCIGNGFVNHSCVTASIIDLAALCCCVWCQSVFLIFSQFTLGLHVNHLWLDSLLKKTDSSPHPQQKH